jgi:hypothetical protein
MTNKALQYMMPYGFEEEYKSINSYITYDFETMNNTNVNNDNMKATKIENTLYLLSMGLTVVINQKINRIVSFYLRDYKNEQDMIVSFLKTIKRFASKIIKHNKITISESGVKFPNKFQFVEITIIGINSAKFDMNLIVKSLNN